jgi:hypothetical protein
LYIRRKEQTGIEYFLPQTFKPSAFLLIFSKLNKKGIYPKEIIEN